MAKRLAVEILVMIAIGLVIGLLGPFGTFAMPPALRILSWIVWLLAGYAFFRPTGIVAGWLCETTGVPRGAGDLLALAVAALPVTLIIVLLTSRLDLAGVLLWNGFWTMYLYILLIAVVVVAVMKALFRDRDAAAIAEERAPPPPAGVSGHPAIALPPGFGLVRALKGEDHYVRVIGDAREEMVLMRMRDAIERLGDVDGLRVHRSWWVARDAVAAVRRNGRTAVVTLTTGHEAPVARDAMPALRAAGWI